MNETEIKPPLDLQCEAKFLTGAGPVKITVGEIFQMDCLSESIALNPKQARLVVELETKDGKKKEDLYTLKLLKADITPDGKWAMQVTSYKVGQYDNLNLQITDGINTMAIKGIKFQVASVIDPKDPPTQPFGPYGPFLTEFPWGGLWILLSILGVLIAGAVIKTLRIASKKRLVARMKQFDSPQLPVPQFYAEMRKLEREIDFVFADNLNAENATQFIIRIEKALKLFLVRQFQLPAFEWNNKNVLKDFRFRFIWFGDDIQTQLAVLLRELEKAQKLTANAKDTKTEMTSKLTSKDVHQLLKNLKRWVDRVSQLGGKQ